MNHRPKVLVALSGGVDSAVCAHLLLRQGYDVAGVVLKMSPAHEIAVEQAKVCADKLGIPLLVRDETAAFEEKVVRPFIDEYRAGRTPNPCIVCNPNVKFRALVETADEHGYDYIATGHYADMIERDGAVLLKIGKSRSRDQTYMLHRLGQDVLRRLLLPLADYEKTAVREIAAECGLPCASQPDSQEICFIPDNDYAGYIERVDGACPPGDFIGPDGAVCGRHKGILHYTIGQRKGLGIALGQPVFVTRIDSARNTVQLGLPEQLMTNRLVLAGLASASGQPFSAPFDGLVKIRSTAVPVPARIEPVDPTHCRIRFPAPLRAPAEGQSAAIYDGEDVLLGGGFIVENGLA